MTYQIPVDLRDRINKLDRFYAKHANCYTIDYDQVKEAILGRIETDKNGKQTVVDSLDQAYKAQVIEDGKQEDKVRLAQISHIMEIGKDVFSKLDETDNELKRTAKERALGAIFYRLIRLLNLYKTPVVYAPSYFKRLTQAVVGEAEVNSSLVKVIMSRFQIKDLDEAGSMITPDNPKAKSLDRLSIIMCCNAYKEHLEKARDRYNYVVKDKEYFTHLDNIIRRAKAIVDPETKVVNPLLAQFQYVLFIRNFNHVLEEKWSEIATILTLFKADLIKLQTTNNDTTPASIMKVLIKHCPDVAFATYIKNNVLVNVDFQDMSTFDKKCKEMLEVCYEYSLIALCLTVLKFTEGKKNYEVLHTAINDALMRSPQNGLDHQDIINAYTVLQDSITLMERTSVFELWGGKETFEQILDKQAAAAKQKLPKVDEEIKSFAMI